IKKDSFHKNKGLSNELGYYIFDYDSKYELKVRNYTKNLINKINNKDFGFNIIEFDLYNIVIEILESKDFLKKTFDLEEKNGLNKTNQGINKLLQLSDDNNSLIINYIKNKVLKNSVIFITGVGKVFPILRSHNVLNNLHHHIDKNPVVMFFPGTFTGNEFRLFDTIKDNNYYRAFPLISD
ncbi:MAG: DUF1788 domain-containing protein, partial [Methanobrevibacter sp.]|nr:DUF1788 domain-containing protein [Methanobrevibacter sp.]